MKDIIILGRPRAGKSTLADKLVDSYGYQVIRHDPLREAFKKVFPELGISQYTAIDNNKWYDFLKKYYEKMKECSRYKYGYIIEGCEMHISKCIEVFGKENVLIYVLGQINISAEQMANNIEKYDTKDDWTKNKQHEELVNYCSNSIEKAKKIKEECEKYNIPFFDTSTDREKVLQEIIELIEEENNQK